jgi:hypothetical protein
MTRESSTGVGREVGILVAAGKTDWKSWMVLLVLR